MPDKPVDTTDFDVRTEDRTRPIRGTYVELRQAELPDPRDPGLEPLRVVTSAQWDVELDGRDFTSQFRDAHTRRKASRFGGAKGRVLYLRRRASPLAVVCWSLPPAGYPLVVLAAATARRTFASGQQSVAAVETLLATLSAIAAEAGHPADQLAWNPRGADDAAQDAAAREVYRLFGFMGMPRDRIPRHARGKHYMLRPKKRVRR